ncbi:MAG: MsnO8 family LLM class oxidoreductase, partial [Caldimonas sp.]
ALAGPAPEVLLARLGAETSRIRLGSGGVMLPHYSPLKVVESFRVLHALYPERIDLGVGRAPGGDMRTARALNPNAHAAADNFPEQVRDLQAWTSIGTHLGITAHPLGPHAPEVWILGSSDYGAQLAAHFGLPYAYAYFFTDGLGTEQALDLYRRLYRPSERHPRPQATLCVWALAADTHAEALHHALGRDRWRIDRARGVLGPLQSPDAIAARGFSADETSVLEPMRAKAFVGTGAEVAERLRALAAQFELDEIVVNTWAHDPAARRTSYTLLAREFALDAQAASPQAE